MLYPLLADLVLIVHLAFVVFVLCGGLLVLRWQRIAWLHLPAATWGVRRIRRLDLPAHTAGRLVARTEWRSRL